jgi:hypothetical protein
MTHHSQHPLGGYQGDDPPPKRRKKPRNFLFLLSKPYTIRVAKAPRAPQRPRDNEPENSYAPGLRKLYSLPYP